MTADAVTDPALQLALRGGAALLLVAAASHKLRDLGAFREVLRAYGLLPGWALAPVGAALAGAEAGVGVACLAPGLAPAACAAGAGLVALYSSAIAYNLARGRRSIDCGCGGPGGRQTLSGSLLARNAVVVALLLAAAVPAADRPLVWLDAITAGGLLAALALLYAAADVALANAARFRAEGVPAWTRR